MVGLERERPMGPVAGNSEAGQQVGTGAGVFDLDPKPMERSVGTETSTISEAGSRVTAWDWSSPSTLMALTVWSPGKYVPMTVSFESSESSISRSETWYSPVTTDL